MISGSQAPAHYSACAWGCFLKGFMLSARLPAHQPACPTACPASTRPPTHLYENMVKG
jgi:hypothetical protein